jgi:hypothetical protein
MFMIINKLVLSIISTNTDSSYFKLSKLDKIVYTIKNFNTDINNGYVVETSLAIHLCQNCLMMAR